MRAHLAVASALALAVSLAVSLAGCSREQGPVKITASQNGYEPPTVYARAGQPLTLIVTRVTDQTCATEFVLPDENLNVPLPLNEPVVIVFTPKKAGKLRYSCGMRMFFGDIEVK